MRKIIFLFIIFLMSSAAAVADSTQIKIVALGDSTTAGTPGFCSPKECPPAGQGDPENQYAYWVMKKHPEWEVVNQGVNGERTGQILERMQVDVLELRPRAVIVLAGVNDLFQRLPLAAIQRNLALIYDRAREAGIDVLACTVIPYDRSTPEVKQKMSDLNEWIRVYSVRKGDGFCDTYHAAEDPANPGHLIGSPDGLHPSKRGYRDMGELISG